MSLSQNRHHAMRVKNNRKHYYTANNGFCDARSIGMTAITPKRCNCWMCSNQRKSFGEPFSDTKRKSANKHSKEYLGLWP